MSNRLYDRNDSRRIGDALLYQYLRCISELGHSNGQRVESSHPNGRRRRITFIRERERVCVCEPERGCMPVCDRL